MASSTLNPDGTPKSLMQLASEQMAVDNTIDPTLTTFDESKGVAGRVASLTADTGSPLMQQAATQGTQIAASRGLTNSSLAAESSQQAVIGAALPIATQDASLYSRAQEANQQASNSAKMTNAQLGVQAGMQGMQLGESGRQFDATKFQNKEQFDQQMKLQNQQLDAQISQFAQQLGVTVQDLSLRRDSLTQAQQQFLANLDQQKATLAQNATQFAAQQTQQLVLQKMNGDQQLALAGIEAKYKTALQGNVNISQAWGTTMNNIATIQNNPNLEGPARATLIQNSLDAFASFTNFWQKQQGGDAGNIDDLLNFTITGSSGETGGKVPTPTPAPPGSPGSPGASPDSPGGPG